VNKKKLLLTIILLVIIAAIALFFIFKGKAATEPVPEQAKPYRIALVMKTLTNPFFVTMERGARKAEAEFGITLLVKTGAQETSIEQQILIVEQMIQDKVDAIVIAPASSVELVPVIKKAQDAGIVIVNIDNQLDQEQSQKANLTNVPFISVDNAEGAYLSASYIAKQVTKPTKAVILDGIITAKNAQQRKAGAQKAFKENPLIKVVAEESAEWKIDKAFEVISRIFKRTPDVKLIFCANDMMAIGVIQYLKDAGHRDVKVAAFDDLDEVKPLLKDGSLAATINQQADLQGYMGISYAVKMLKGEKVEPIKLVPVKLITNAE
jgi:ribose transport system substrate-binding protein